MVGLFDLWSGLATILISASGTYAIAAYIQGPYMPWIGFVFNMGYMSISHMYRQILNDPTKIDITGAQMVMVMKLTGFCWNVYDGRQKESELNDHQKDRALRQLPSILDYAGFVLFFPALMIGPAFDFVDYQRWIETSMFDLPPGTDPSKAPPTRKKRRIPRSGTPASWKVAEGLLWFFLFLQFDGYFNTSVVLGDQYHQYGFLRRIWILYMLNLVTRFKYYGAWTLTEGACILSGIGYKGIDPKTGKADWSRLQNVSPYGVEFAQNSHAYLGGWNMNTNHWLRNYMYLRVTPKGKKPGFRATLATFVTSAFWHGFYPGYYLTFVLGSFLQNVSKSMLTIKSFPCFHVTEYISDSRRLLRPFFMQADGKTPLPRKRYYDFFSYIVTQLAFCFCTTPFILLTIKDTMKVWASVYFYCIIGVTACSVFLLTPGKQWLSAEVKKRNRPAMVRADSQDGHPLLGLPNDPGKEWDDMVGEIKAEVDARKKHGQPITGDLKRAADKLGKET